MRFRLKNEVFHIRYLKKGYRVFQEVNEGDRPHLTQWTWPEEFYETKGGAYYALLLILEVVFKAKRDKD